MVIVSGQLSLDVLLVLCTCRHMSSPEIYGLRKLIGWSNSQSCSTRQDFGSLFDHQAAWAASGSWHSSDHERDCEAEIGRGAWGVQTSGCFLAADTQTQGNATTVNIAEKHNLSLGKTFYILSRRCKGTCLLRFAAA